MSVRDRLEDAQALLKNNRFHGAFVHVLIAAAATSRKRYPRGQWADNQSFKNFVYDEMGVITGGPKYRVEIPFRGETVPLEDVLYDQFRNQLLHEAAVPDDIFFTDPVVKEGVSHNIMKLGSEFGFPKAWLTNLAIAVWLAPENDDLWQDQEDERVATRQSLGDLVHDGLYCRRPGSFSKQSKS